MNANGTLVMLETTRKHASEVPFIFTSTNKVYGDRPNIIALDGRLTRWDDGDAAFEHGMDSDQFVILQNADLIGEGLHLDDAPARAVRPIR